MRPRDVVVIGAGPNGLVAAARLARAGRKPLVLERRERIGGTSVTEEIHPGFRASTVTPMPAPLLPRVVRDLELARHGLVTVRPAVRVFAPSRDGGAVLLYDDPARSLPSISRFSRRDAERFPAFHDSLARIGAALRPLLSMTPPPIEHPAARDLWRLLQTGRRVRALGKKDEYRLLRWLPMAVADLAAEWFDSEPLRATVAARGVYGTFAAPWSAGTGANLLLSAAAEGHSAAPAEHVRGGMGALADALASSGRAAGAEIRTSAEVVRIRVRGGATDGVVLADGEEIPARVVVSSVDPRTTFLRLLEPADLDPGFLQKIGSYRSIGAAAKVHFALSRLPRFRGVDSGGSEREAAAGRIHLAPETDDIERAFDAAKYGDFSPRPFCEATIPTLLDPSLAPEGAHVLSAHVQYAPYRLANGDWNRSRNALADAVTRTIEEHAPGFEGTIVARTILTPVDLESTYGLAGGHLFHGEHALDQLFVMRPLLGWGRYRTPIERLYLSGSGTHPGGGVSGAPGWNAAREILRDSK
ncbi:MAG TPA: NAD(P)/FAD-dependent oxidoreductase [Thermoanaerobaculia bacterium]